MAQAQYLAPDMYKDIKQEYVHTLKVEVKSEYSENNSSETGIATACIKEEAIDKKLDESSSQSIAWAQLQQATINNVVEKHYGTSFRREKLTLFRCSSCSYHTKNKSHLTVHILTHKNPSEITMFHCELCPYKTKHNSNLKRHMLVHKNPCDVTKFKCELCLYETPHKSYLKTHMLIHKSHSEVTTFKCTVCSYETKHKANVKKHMPKHKELLKATAGNLLDGQGLAASFTTDVLTDEGSPTMSKCEMCTYETKHKSNLAKHMIRHKNSSEVTMYKCALCSYTSKYKGNVAPHMITHTTLAEATMLKCNHCLFETKRKDTLKRHVLKHRFLLN